MLRLCRDAFATSSGRVIVNVEFRYPLLSNLEETSAKVRNPLRNERVTPKGKSEYMLRLCRDAFATGSGRAVSW